MPSQLAPCPNKPNCVSTQAQDPRKQREPLPYTGSMTEARRRLQALIEQMPRTRLVAERDDFLHYEFSTFIGNFVDDVTFLFDADTRQVHYRSASRKGYWDFGANSRRMRAVQKSWQG